MKYFLLLVGIWFIQPYAYAQKNDTTFLSEITVFAFPTTAHATGSKIQHLSLQQSPETLTDALQNVSSVYLKTYGNNQLGSIAFRGTTASQTAILWNGININSPTLGQTDLSVIPLFLVEEVLLQYGTGGSLYGSDAIGGTLMLGSTSPKFNKERKVLSTQQAGSFGRTASGLKLKFSNQRFEYRTKLFYTRLKNNFSFTSPAVGYEKVQQHAAVESFGMDQQIHYKINDHAHLSWDGMYTDNFREIQPVVTNDSGDETLADKNIRTSLGYTQDFSKSILRFTAAYVFSDQDYFNDVFTKVKSHQLSSLFSVDQTLSNKSNFRYGVNYNYYRASSSVYSNVSDHRFDVFGSYRYALLPSLVVDVNLRQSFYDETYAPFAPTVGGEWTIAKSSRQKILFKLLAGRGFRIPTLNDRFWQPGGNPQLKPEESKQFESSLEYNFNSSLDKFHVNVTYYQTWVNKMIVWMPGNQMWSPLNLQQVNINGIEVMAKCEKHIGKIAFSPSFSYSFTKSINEKHLTASDKAVGKQLPYIPLHQAVSSLQVSYNRWTFNTNLNYAGKRFTTLDNTDHQKLEDYALVNSSIGRGFIFSKWSWSVKAEIRNIMDVYYENVQNNAMPGRNYLITITINN